MLTKKQRSDIKSKFGASTTNLPLVFQALGDSGRFRIFRLLMDHHEICVTDVAAVLDITVSAASQQLRVLERLGLVVRMRMGQMVCYEINQKHPTTKQLVTLLRESSK